MVFVKRWTIVISFRGIWSRVVSPIRCTVYVSPFYFRVSLQSKEMNAFAGKENLRSSAVTVVARIFPLSFPFLSRAIVSWIFIERFIVHAKHLQLSRWQIGLNTKNALRHDGTFSPFSSDVFSQWISFSWFLRTSFTRSLFSRLSITLLSRMFDSLIWSKSYNTSVCANWIIECSVSITFKLD